ncbi:uncharacterized protein SOCE26_057870 [Sorangium cellulosum]|uniref:Uncharacterized protein n=1 Tax=Sorangium cellulosum TaxID=56 RepID=A0A2L0EYF5_SORCE|nr:hypothetical protein [Sorangium cellulosum]AUX44323.1 uncharacterized protein SOCE26_057870 [Sorangium cellulosum]
MAGDTQIHELERLLAAAQERQNAASAAVLGLHQGGEWQAYDAACAQVLALERRVAAAKGEPHAVPLEFPVRWNTGAPLPHLISNDHQTFLAFRIRVPDPDWDGSYATARSPDAVTVEPLALVEFQRCASAKLGAPNDEVFSGHPLHGRGLEPYTAQLVVGSPWLAEMERINSIHPGYCPERWRSLKHYVFWFHDVTFECVAESFSVEVFHETFAALLARVCARITSRG